MKHSLKNRVQPRQPESISPPPELKNHMYSVLSASAERIMDLLVAAMPAPGFHALDVTIATIIERQGEISLGTIKIRELPDVVPQDRIAELVTWITISYGKGAFPVLYLWRLANVRSIALVHFKIDDNQVEITSPGGVS